METFEWAGETYSANPAVLGHLRRAQDAGKNALVRTILDFGLRNGHIMRDAFPEEPEVDQPLVMNFSELPWDTRLEMLIGLVQDHLASTLTLVERITVRANASHATRSHLASIGECQMLVYKETQALRAEVASLRRQLAEQEGKP